MNAALAWLRAWRAGKVQATRLDGQERQALDAMRRINGRCPAGCRAEARERHPSSQSPRVLP